MSVGHGTGGGGPFPRRRDTAFHRPHAHTQIDGKERRGRTKTLMEKRGGKERRKERCRINIQAPRAIFALPIFHHFFPAYKSRLKISRMLFLFRFYPGSVCLSPFSLFFASLTSSPAQNSHERRKGGGGRGSSSSSSFFPSPPSAQDIPSPLFFQRKEVGSSREEEEASTLPSSPFLPLIQSRGKGMIVSEFLSFFLLLSGPPPSLHPHLRGGTETVVVFRLFRVCRRHFCEFSPSARHSRREAAMAVARLLLRPLRPPEAHRRHSSSSSPLVLLFATHVFPHTASFRSSFLPLFKLSRRLGWVNARQEDDLVPFPFHVYPPPLDARNVCPR